MTLSEILALFPEGDSNPAGNGYNVTCPSHDDKSPSLSITAGKKGIVMKCQAQCGVDRICKDLGIALKDLFFTPTSQNGSAKTGSWRLLGSWQYFHASGNLAYEVLKHDTPEGKQFTIRWKAPDGRWVNGSTTGEYYLVPYYDEWRRVKPKTPANYQRQIWPELTLMLYRGLDASQAIWKKPDEVLLIVEGEKDVDRCWKEGFIATSNTGGANRKWKAEYSKAINAKKVVIIPDDDPPTEIDSKTGKVKIGLAGQKHAEEIRLSLAKLRPDIEVIVLPVFNRGLKEDISDWFDAGHTADELRALIDAAFQATQSQSAASVSNPPPPPNSPPNASPNPRPQSAKDYNTTDMGNAERFADKFGNIARYCSKLGKDGVWLIWDGARWQIDEKLKIHRMAKEIVPDIYIDSQNAGLQADKIRLFKWAIQTEGLATRNNMVKDARPALAIAVDELDTHPWLLNVKNGTIDLRTGNLRPHAQADYLTKMLPIEYDDQAKCDAWMDFINTAQWDKQEMIDYLQKAVGYSLTGDTGEKCMFILHGPKDTGKSTFVETMQMLLDEYAIKIQTQTLMWRREKQQSNDIAILKGARFVHASEAEEHERLAEAQIKEMTGGDTITCRFLHAEFFQFQPEFKLWLSTNHKPKASNDEALWGRLKLIPFTYRITEDQKDRKLKAKLRDELPGILKWAIDGCLKWQTEGLKDPSTVSDATGTYRTQMDTIGHFLDDCCEIGDPLMPGFVVSAKDLYQAYKQWCMDAGERPDSQRALGLKLKDRGLQNETITSGPSKGRTEWLGIKLR